MPSLVESTEPRPLGWSIVVSAPDGVRIDALGQRRTVVIGRDADCDVVLEEPCAARRHARVDLGGPPTLEDLGSAGGTRVAGRRLRSGERVTLSEDVVIAVGATRLLLRRTTSCPEREPSLLVVDPAMARVYDMLTKIARTTLTVLVLGETGCGKELAAQTIHRRSPRGARPLVTLNCACVPESVLESELFGHERGAFTGAVSAKAGLFEAADGGTLFLDEVGELSPSAQAKLLRVLEGGELLRVGSTVPKRVDVRIVAATHRDLPALVRENRFREDLYFRLQAATVRVPPLRERPRDVIPLAEHFAERAAATLGRPPPLLAPCARAALHAHAWPGNVRELRNVIQHAIALSDAAILEAAHLPLPTSSERRSEEPEHGPKSDVREAMRSFEKEQILRALDQVHGNQTRAAEILGITRRTLTNKLNAHGIARPRKRCAT